MPESVVGVRRELLLLRQPLQRRPLPDGLVIFDELEDTAGENKKAAVDPSAITSRLLLHGAYDRPGKAHGAEAAWRPHGREGGESPLPSMVFNQRRDVDIGQPVAIRHAERLVMDVFRDALQPATGLSIQPRFHESNPPRLRSAVVHFHGIV